jgi:cellulose synthase/poly-beta-1,6-N-acetylglucosamine synthase-like glycosyltransferase
MNTIAVALVSIPFVLIGYAYVLYPLLLRVGVALPGRASRRRTSFGASELPFVTFTLPAYNAERTIGSAIENVLASDYPPDRREIFVVSDCSDDNTDDIVLGFASRGISLLRLPERRGKTAAENAVGRLARGDIIVNMDATVRIQPRSLGALVDAFADPTVGVASGFDSSVGTEADANGGESGYVGYEMWVRELETRLGGIVGASGCFYGIRRDVHDTNFPEHLSRDFASVLIARFRGYRAVSVRDALCYVPRTKALDAELERKVRTMARGLETLWHMRALLNPVRYLWFAFKLFSHKLCRWLVSLSLPGGVLGLAMLGLSRAAFMPALVVFAAGVVLGIAGLRWSSAGQQPPRVLALAGFALAANLAGMRAWYRALRGQSTPVWEPTRRPA